jgi:hypothetical protein
VNREMKPVGQPVRHAGRAAVFSCTFGPSECLHLRVSDPGGEYGLDLHAGLVTPTLDTIEHGDGTTERHSERRGHVVQRAEDECGPRCDAMHRLDLDGRRQI